ncbi:MAG: glycosyltransferase family 4 protein [Candidatus Hydrogenedentes bacterium]|nr:glycosyltransferase family 4 protein [Candidatus Hydrogenedentota bacterium]
MRILFLCQYFPPEMGAPSARTYEHAKEWVEQGHEVVVVCGLPNHPDGIVPPEYRGKLVVRETFDGIKVLRGWLYATPNRGVVKRSIAFLTFMLSSMLVAIFLAGKCDIVVATSPQMLCGLAGYIVSIFKRAPFVLEIRDLWPAQIVDLGVIRNRFIIGLLYRLESFLYRRAKAIVTIAPAMSKEIADRGFGKDKIFTIPNGIDENFFKSSERKSGVREEKGWQDNLVVVMYIGTMGLSQGLDVILKTAEILRNEKDIRFVFVGAGADRERLMTLANEWKLTNVEFYQPVKKAEMPEWYSAGDIFVVPLKRRKVFLYNIPSKMFEIMACEKPIVLGVDGQAKQILEESKGGICVEPENHEEFANAILKLAKDPEMRIELGKRGREYVVKYFSRKENAKRYLEVFEWVVKRSENRTQIRF